MRSNELVLYTPTNTSTSSVALNEKASTIVTPLSNVTVNSESVQTAVLQVSGSEGPGVGFRDCESQRFGKWNRNFSWTSTTPVGVIDWIIGPSARRSPSW